jgi:hypothetical protein
MKRARRWARGGCLDLFSLCLLCVFRVSVVNSLSEVTQHRNTEVAQRRTANQLLAAAVAVILIEFAIEGLAADAQRAGGVSFIAPGVVECSFNCLALDLVHR